MHVITQKYLKNQINRDQIFLKFFFVWSINCSLFLMQDTKMQNIKGRCSIKNNNKVDCLSEKNGKLCTIKNNFLPQTTSFGAIFLKFSILMILQTVSDHTPCTQDFPLIMGQCLRKILVVEVKKMSTACFIIVAYLYHLKYFILIAKLCYLINLWEN